MKISTIVVTVLALAAAPALAQQAGIQLQGSNGELGYHNDTSWDLSIAGQVSDASVAWVITATRGETTHNDVGATGYLRVTNNGTGPATIGNIVVNLQRKIGTKWVTVSSDVADATSGDAATSAKIVKGASSEGLSSFSENSASGPLSFTNADSNTIFSLVPQFSLPAGETINLLYSTAFDNNVLGVPVGELLRTETIVTFGNAGPRGGSGASAPNIDINGNGTIDADEKNVRSVPVRITRALPELHKCNDTLTLSDTAADLATTGTVTVTNFTTDIGGGAGTEIITNSVVRTVVVDVDPGTDGGSITDTAYLFGADYVVTVTGPTDSLTGLPTYSYDFVLCAGLFLQASDTQTIVAPVGFQPGDFFTYGQGGWGSKVAGSNPGTILANNFTAVYPSGVEVGIPGATGFSMKFTSATNVKKYLPATSTPNKLTADLVNQTKSSSGVFGGQVLSLRLNVDYSAAGVTQGPGGAFGSLILHDTGTSLDGQSVSQILAAAETALGGGALPDGFTYSTLNNLATALNESFEDGNPSVWAVDHLFPGGPSVGGLGGTPVGP